jgi:hypothetical protein
MTSFLPFFLPRSLDGTPLTLFRPETTAWLEFKWRGPAGRVLWRLQGRHSPNVSTILLRFFYDFSMIIPRAHFPAFPR